MTEQKINNLLTTLGLCARARKLVFGTEQICEALKSGKHAPYLILEACDTSDNTHKRLSDRCKYYGVELVRLECDTLSLAKAVGKLSALSAVGISDAGFCKMIRAKLDAKIIK